MADLGTIDMTKKWANTPEIRLMKRLMDELGQI